MEEMNKKVITIGGAVLALIAGAILVAKVPVSGIPVAFLEVCAGFVCGMFFNKAQVEEAFASYEKEILSLKFANEAVRKELAQIKANFDAEVKSVNSATTAVKKSTKTNKSKASKTNN